MNYLPEFVTVVLIHLLAVMSPGPDFAMISRNSLVYSRKIGIYSALGLALGIMIHVTYSLVGIGFIISQSIILFSTIKLLGAAYLIWIGYKSLKAKPVQQSAERNSQSKVISRSNAIRMGLLTNALNPKVTLFFLALFTQVINPATPLVLRIAYGLETSLMTFLWFSFVATVLSHRKIKERFQAVQHKAEKVFGALLFALGLKIALSKSR
ncbi:MAG: LysE family transporter [Patescibacteria group bacterium]|jgi:RhtB (resistance to homoserine/threonine) family protein